MTQGLNKVMLIGYLGKTPEVKTFNDGAAYSNVSLATHSTWKDKQTGEQKQATQWHQIFFSRRLAVVLAEFCHQGSFVYVEGRLRTRCWDNDRGEKQYTTDIVASQLLLLDKKQDDDIDDNNSNMDDNLPF
ncbi:MAG: single-stranded DNA-binding protein [Gammaproteobacteria bacterium]